VEDDDTVVSKLERLDNVIITPHIGGGTIETRQRMFRELAE
jgi:phosphoglycerate dehydrogenase-like enzyme